MMRSIPLVKFRAVRFVWHLRSNHEVGFVRFHACSSSTATLAMSRVAILWNAANPSPALVYRTRCDRPEHKRGAAAYLSALTRIRGSTMLILSLLTGSLCDNP